MGKDIRPTDKQHFAWGALSLHSLDVGPLQIESNLLPLFLDHGLLILSLATKVQKGGANTTYGFIQSKGNSSESVVPVLQNPNV